MAPHFESAAGILRNNDPPVALIKVIEYIMMIRSRFTGKKNVKPTKIAKNKICR